jgi:hypothetical protein
MIERIVERLPPTKAKASYMVEVAGDGVHLDLKQYERGTLIAQRNLRATALPYGWYTVVGRDVVHRHEPEEILDDVRRHQLRMRAGTREFQDALRKLGREVGGRAEPVEDVVGGFAIETRRKPSLAGVRKKFRDAPFLICEGWLAPVVATCGDTPRDVLVAWFPHLHGLFGELDRACGIAAIEQIGHRYASFMLARAPKQPASLVTALGKAVDEGEGMMSARAWKQALAARRIALWFEA